MLVLAGRVPSSDNPAVQRPAIAIILLALFAGATASAAPPPGLTGHARVVWNLDALVRDEFGKKRVCVYANTYLKVGSGYCAQDYTFTFARARHARFRLVTRASNPLGGPYGPNAIPVRFYGRRGPYVSCGQRQWLAVTNARSQNWPIACVSP
jgi:hypothetical protein